MTNRMNLQALVVVALAALGCSEQQPRNACSMQVTNGYYGVVGYNARYTVLTAAGDGCKAFLGVDQPGQVTGETLGVTTYGRFGGKIGLRPLSAAAASDGTGVGAGDFDSTPTSCTAATLSAAEYVIDDPSYVAPDPLPDPAPAAPQVKASYLFTDVKFLQAANIPGTQLTASLSLKVAPAEAGNGAASCDATLAVAGIWTGGGYLRCESDADCAPDALGLPGAKGDYACSAFMPLMPDYVPVTDASGIPQVDGNGEPLTQPVVPQRCAPTGQLPVGAIPFED